MLILAGFGPTAEAATTNFTFETNYSATGVDQWGSTSDGYQNSATYQNFFGTSWDESTNFGGFSYGLFGDKYGFQGEAYTEGKVGLDVYYKGSTGSVDIHLANTVNLAVSDLTGPGAGSIYVTQSRPLPSTGNVMTSVFPTMEVSVNAYFQIDAGIRGEFAYGFGSTSGSLTLEHLKTAFAIAAGNPLLAVVDPFDLQLNLFTYNLNNSHQITVGGTIGTLFGEEISTDLLGLEPNGSIPVANLSSPGGLNIPLTADRFIPESRLGNYDVSANTQVEYGSITVHDPYLMNLSSGDGFVATGKQDRILSLGVDPGGLATLAAGIPFNPLDPKITLPGTSLAVEATLLKAQLNLDLGLEQELTLDPNTVVRLLSNYDVTYTINGIEVTTSDLRYFLPDDGSAVDIQITGKPLDANGNVYSDWLLTPTVYVDPTLKNQLDLNFSTSLQVTAGVFTVVYNGIPLPVIPALYSENIPFGDLGAISLIDRTISLGNLEEFQRVYRSLRALVGGNVPQNFSVGLGESIVENEISGTFKAQPIAGSLTLMNSSFDNITKLEVPGTLYLNGPSNLVGANGLNVTGTLTIDRGSQLLNFGEVDANGNFLLDPLSLKVPGFVNADGVLVSGTFDIAGRLIYSGSDIRVIASGASLTLVGDPNDANFRIENDGHDPLRHLEGVAGALSLTDLIISSDQAMLNQGRIALLGTSHISSPGYSSTACAVLAIGGGNTYDASGGTFGNLSSGGVLTNFNVALGDYTGASFIYSGPGIVENRSTLILSGARPADGYLVQRTGASTFADGLASLAINSGMISLVNGASQTLTGGLTNNYGATIGITMPASPANPVAPFSTLTINGPLTNYGSIVIDGGRLNATTLTQILTPATALDKAPPAPLLQLTRGAEANFSGTIVDGNGVLQPGQYLVDGIIRYNGDSITTIAKSSELITKSYTDPVTGVITDVVMNQITDVRISGAGHGFERTGGDTNAFASLATNNGAFALLAGATATSNVAFTNTGTLTIGANSSFTTRGLTANTGNLNVSYLGTYDTTGGVAGNWTSANSLPLTAVGLLTGGGTTNIAGSLLFAGPAPVGGSGSPLTGVAEGTTLAINHTTALNVLAPAYEFGGALVSVDPSTGATGNGFANFSTVAGTLALGGGSATRTDASLSVTSTGRLILAASSTLQITGQSFNVANGSTVSLLGNLILGGGANTTTFTLPDGASLAANTQLGRVVGQLTVGNIAYYQTTGRGAVTSTGNWTNSNSITGVGHVSGQHITNTGVIYAIGGDRGAGDALVIDPTGAATARGTLTNTGNLGSGGSIDASGNLLYTSRLTISDMDIVNSVTTGNTTKDGQIYANSYVDLNRTTVTGGTIAVTAIGRLSLFDSTLSDVALTSEGAIDILDSGFGDSVTTIGGAVSLRSSSVLTIMGNGATGATLNVAAGSAFTNAGKIIVQSGASLTGSTVTNNSLITILGGHIGDLTNIDNQADGTVRLDHGTNIEFTGTYLNAGRIELSGEAANALPSGVSVSQGTITLLGDTTLTGGGIIQLGGYSSVGTLTATNGAEIRTPVTQWRNGSLDLGNGTITGAAGTTLTLANQTLKGQGNVGDGQLTIINEASSLIGVFGDGSALTIQSGSGGFTNRGTLDIGNGSTLHVTGGNFHSFLPEANGENAILNEGRYRVAGTFKVDGLTSFDNNATIVFSGANAQFVNDSNQAVHIINNLQNGILEVMDGASYHFSTDDVSFSNAGTLIAQSNSVLGITGEQFLNFANHTLTNGAYNVAGTLYFDDADIRANAANITLRGSGQILDGPAGLNGLRNFAINTGRFALDANANYTVSGGVSTFDQRGIIAVNAGSTFDFGTAAANNVGANYWVAGTLRSSAPDTILTAGSHLTLFGAQAILQEGNSLLTTPSYIKAGSTLTMAGGYTVAYAPSWNMVNAGTWEIGSTNAQTFTGTTQRSSAQVTFGSASEATTIANAGGTIRYYGGPTDDGSVGKFLVNNLTINGGNLDLNGDVTMASGADLNFTGTLQNTLSPLRILSLVNDSTNRGHVTINGGLDLRSPINVEGVKFDYNYIGGYSIYLVGMKLTVDSGSIGSNSGDLTLINGADIVNRNGFSIFSTMFENHGRITLSNTPDYLAANDPLLYTRLHLARPDFANYGAIDTKLGGQFRLDGEMTNRGIIEGSLMADSLINYGTAAGSINVVSILNKNGGTMSGTFLSQGITNEFGATLSGTGFIRNGGSFINNGLVTSASFSMDPVNGTSQFGEVQNYGDLTINALSLRRSNLTASPIFNAGTLRVSGQIENDLSGGGEVRLNQNTQFLGNNSNFYGDLYLGSHELRITGDAQLGGADPLNGSYGQVNIGTGGILGVRGALQGTRVIAVADGATIDGYDPNARAVISNSITTPGVLNIAGGVTLNSVFGPSINLVQNADLELLYGATLSGALTGSGTLTITNLSWLSLHETTLDGLIKLTNPGSNLSLDSAIFTAHINSAGQSVHFNQTAAMTYGGIISGTTDVRINEGAVTFDHQQSYTGATIIAEGTSLTLTNGAAPIANNGIVAFPVGGVAGNILNNGTFIISTTADQLLGTAYASDEFGTFRNYHYGIAGNGNIIHTGTNLLTATNGSFLNNLTIERGKFQAGEGTTSITGSYNVTNNGVLRMNHVGSATLDVTGSGNFENYGAGDVTLTLNGGTTVDHFGSGTVTLASGNTYTGKTRVGSFIAPVNNTYFGQTIGGGTLRIADDSSLGGVPTSFVADQLEINGGTLSIIGVDHVTLAANRGVTVGPLGVTFDIPILSLTLPTVLTTAGTSVSLEKMGAGALNLLLHETTDPFAYKLTQGALNLINQGGTTSITSLITSSDNSILTFSGGGTILANTSADTFLGRMEVASGTTLQLRGSTAGSPGASSLNYLVVNGTLQGMTPNETFKSLVGTGSFIRSGGGTVTVGTIDLNMVTLPHATLEATSYNAGTTILSTEGSSTLKVVNGTTGALQMAGSATFDVANSFAVNGGVTGSSTITKTGEGLLSFKGGGTVTNNFQLNEGLLGGANGTTFGGAITGNGGFFMAGTTLTDTVRLTANNSYTGGTFVSVGELILGNGGTSGSVAGDIVVSDFGGISFNRSGTLVLANSISGAGYFKQAGPGTLVVDTATEYTGATYIAGGTLQIGNGGTTGSLALNAPADVANNLPAINVGAIANNAALVFNRSNALRLDNDITGTGSVSQIGLGTTTLHGALSHTGETHVTNGKLVIASSATNAGGITVDRYTELGLLSPGAVGGSIANLGTVSLDSDADYTIGFNSTGDGVIIKNGIGLALLGTSTHANGIEIAAGRLGYASGDTLTSNVRIYGDGTFYKGGSGTLKFLDDNVAFNGDVYVDGGTLQFGDGGTTGMLQAAITLADNTTTVAFNHSNNHSYENVISGAGGLHVSGSGILALTAANTYTGLTTIDAGSILQIGAFDGSIASQNVINNGTLRFDPAFTTRATFNGDSSGTGVIEVQGAGTLTLNGQHLGAGNVTIASGASLALGTNAVMNGLVINEGNLTILTNPSGTRFMPVTFSGGGSLTVAGATTGQGGRLLINGNLTHSGTTLLTDHSTLALAITGTETLIKNISGTGNFEKTGAGKLIVGATGGVAGNIIVSQGILEFGALGSLGTATGTGTYALGDNGTIALNFTSPSATVLDTPFSGTGALHQIGTGDVTLIGDSESTGLQAFHGTTSIDAGRTLNVGSAASGGNVGSLGASTIVANGTLNYDRTGDIALANDISGASTGRLTKSDNGKLTLSGTVALDGAIQIGGDLDMRAKFGSRVGSITAASLTNNGSLTVATVNAPFITNNYLASMIVTGNHAATNQTIKNGGTLTIGDGTTNGSFASDIQNNNGSSVGTLAYNRSDEVRVGLTSSITGGGTLQQLGSGTLQVYSDQFHTVDVTAFLVDAGTMEFMQAITGDITNNATLKLNGSADPARATYANRITNSGTLTTIGDVNLTNAANVYANGTLNLGAGTITLAGSEVTARQLAGVGTLNYSGSSLTLTGDSTHNGALNLASTSLNVGGNFASNVSFTTGGALTFTNTNAATFSGTTTGIDTITHAGIGQLTIDNSIDAIVVTQGALALGSNASITKLTLGNAAGASFDLSGRDATLSFLTGGGAAGGNIALGAKTLTVNQIIHQVPRTDGSGGYDYLPDDTTFAGAISGTGKLVKQGGAALELSGANTFSGGVEVEAGSLILNGTMNSSGGYLVKSAGTLLAHDETNFGPGATTITLNGGRLQALNEVVLSTAQGIVLNGSGKLGGELTVNRTIDGNGVLTVDGGRVLLNGNAYQGGATHVLSGTLAIGNLNAVDQANTTFGVGSAFDVNGHEITNANWTEAINLQGATLANGSSTAVVFSHSLHVDSAIGFAGSGSNLTFSGDLIGSGAVAVTSSGDVTLVTPSAARIASIAVANGTLRTPMADLTALSSVQLTGTGRLELNGAIDSAGSTFAPATLELSNSSVIGNSVSLLNNTNGGSLTIDAALLLNEGDTERRGVALIGGSGDTILTGSFHGELSLTKVGTGNLTLLSDMSGWNKVNSGARLGVREGTLTTDLAHLNNRTLVVEQTGSLAITNDASEALALRSLIGDGTLDLGSRNLDFYQNTSGVFTGSVITTGSVTHQADPNLVLSPIADTQSYGNLTAGSLAIEYGDVTVTDALNADMIFVRDRLTTTTNGITKTGGSILNANFVSIQGTLKLIGGQNVTGNANNFVMQGAQANVIDGNGAAVRFASNSSTGNLVAQAGAVLNVQSTFTNHGYVNVSNGSYIDAAGTINQAAGQFIYNHATLVADRLNITGGTFTLGASGVFQRTGSGNVLTNPGIVMTGGLFNAIGSINGGVKIDGGTFAPGGNYIVGESRISGGLIFGAGGTLGWDMFNATGDSGVGYDLVTLIGGASSAKITVNATAANPFTIAVNSVTGGNVMNFDAEQNYVWTLATMSGGVANFSSDKFTVNTRDFSTAFTGNFGVTANDTELQLVYNAAYLLGESGDLDDPTANFAANGTFGGVTKVGTGTVTLTGNNAITGTSKVMQGTLVLASNTALGTGDAVVSAGATLAVVEGVAISNKVTLAGGTFERTLSGNLTDAVNATSSGGLANTTAQILGGSSAATTTLVTSFIPNIDRYVPDDDGGHFILANEDLLSDIYTLSGTGANAFVLQLSFASTEAAFLPELLWFNPSTELWVNATEGNSANNASFAQIGYAGSFANFQSIYGADLDNYLGAWGGYVDSGVAYSWSVIDHNSSFGVGVEAVPEPSTVGLLIIAAIFVIARHRRRRVRRA